MSVGITLTPKSGTQIKLAADMIAVNNPLWLIILLSANPTKGTYELKAATQYVGGGKVLKASRSVS